MFLITWVKVINSLAESIITLPTMDQPRRQVFPEIPLPIRLGMCFNEF